MQLGFKTTSEERCPDVGRVILPFRFPGGKYYVLGAIRKFWEEAAHDEYREPFVGGGAVFFAKPKVRFNWINDIDAGLINTYKIMASRSMRKPFTVMLSREVANRDRWREMFEFKPKTPLEKAYRYYYLNRTSFSGKMISPAWGYRPKRSIPPERWSEKIVPCGVKLEGVRITCGDFSRVMLAPRRGKSVLLFVDPPYFRPPKRKHYVNGFDQHDHVRVRDILKKTPCKFILTYEDDAEIRAMYKWANIFPIRFFYRVDNSSENGPNVRTGERRTGSELIITNFRPATSSI